MEFKQFADLVSQQFQQLQKTGKLFRSSVTGDELWNMYISSFKPGDNPVFRDPDSSEHNDNLDKSFIRRYGNIVTIDENYNIITIWDLSLPEDNKYYQPTSKMSQLLKSKPISDVFFETYEELNSLNYEKNNKKQEIYRLGIAQNHKIYTQEEATKYGVVKPGQVYQFHHFYGDLNKQFVDQTGKSQAAIIGEFRDNKNVFKRGMDEIPHDTLMLVKDLINQNSLLDGTTHLHKIEKISSLKSEYDIISKKSSVKNYHTTEIKTDNWCWINSYKLPFAKFRNELIGTLCVELAEGKELNEACQTWNKRVDPANYMKATAPITQKQIKQAQEFVQEQGYEESFNRRFATLDDINVDEILHSNVGKAEIKTASVFDKVKSTTPSTRHKRSQFDEVEEVNIEKFMKDILPTCTSIEAFFESKHQGNLVALTTANQKDTKPMFKWNNNFSWTFNGNLAGKSQIKQAVKDRGGKVEAPVRVSIHFPNTTSDYDLHCIEPNRNHIYYGNRRIMQNSSGMLDLDAQGGDGSFPPEKRVENLTYSDISKMNNGNYRIFVHNYSGTRIQTAFTAEVEVLGEIFSLNVKTSTKREVEIGILKALNGNVEFIPNEQDCELIESQTVSKQIWNIDTNQFHKVNLVCLTPNHWGENNVGNKHYLFMLDECKSDVALRSFHVENLNADLLQHRKVMEVLGTTTMLEPTNNQLCGLGFNATVGDEIILKLSGSHKRTVRIKFEGLKTETKKVKKQLQTA
jgi:hypothetical protein